MPGEYKAFLQSRENKASGEHGHQDIPHWKPKERIDAQEIKSSSVSEFLAHYGVKDVKWGTNGQEDECPDNNPDENKEEFFEHQGIPGMKWGRRRFQNPDGSLTPEGRIRYGKGDGENSGGSKSKSSVLKGDSDTDGQEKFNSRTSKTTKDPQTLTDAELNKRLERMRKENEYNNLRKALVPKTRAEKRKEFWKKTMSDASSKLIADITKEVSKATVSFLFKKAKAKPQNRSNSGS